MRYERRETRLENEMGLSRLQMKKIIYEYLVGGSDFRALIKQFYLTF
tara:strand:- start:1170 stop:1310 length:141 start_codon:yes stop_codon:yes gene_type:complete